MWALFPMVEYLCVAVVVNYLIQGGRSPIDRCLNFGPLVFIGQLSYSMYLWQQLFCLKGATLQMNAPMCFIIAMGCAMFSYYVVEQPALRLRQQLSRRRAYEPTPIPLDAVQAPTPA
jgi:peptidoglycan/LPS O-acetylase OafA/YrhL